ncbi:hypothetical protein LE191_12560 [Janthinobacterium sp. HSC-3S05]|uniref:hypothetical protein n=1 Tax=Janthinobacterium lividum TaxID=29581 RepID=UPI001CD8BC24|nr:hypothetical protein [Janthinobacterium lividum]MCA1860935.1 hypothetical protein [Janthinobacterium lividum]
MAKIEKLVKAVVAPGRTVKFEGKNVGPGGDVALPADEVEWLRKGGYLLDPAATAPTIAPGPAFEKDGDGEQSPPAE